MRQNPNRCHDGSWVLVAVFLFIACLFWILWMRDWMASGMPYLPAHPERIGKCSGWDHYTRD